MQRAFKSRSPVINPPHPHRLHPTPVWRSTRSPTVPFPSATVLPHLFKMSPNRDHKLLQRPGSISRRVVALCSPEPDILRHSRVREHRAFSLDLVVDRPPLPDVSLEPLRSCRPTESFRTRDTRVVRRPLDRTLRPRLGVPSLCRSRAMEQRGEILLSSGTEALLRSDRSLLWIFGSGPSHWMHRMHWPHQGPWTAAD